MNLNLAVDNLVKKGLLMPVPEGVEMSDLLTMYDTASERNWTAPSIEMLESVAEEVELVVAKASLINFYSELSFELRKELIPDYKLLNASLDIYSSQDKNNISSTIKKFRDEFYRLKKEIDKAASINELQQIYPDYPKSTGG